MKFSKMKDTHRVGRQGVNKSPLDFIYEDFLNMRKHYFDYSDRKRKIIAACNLVKEKILITYEGFSASAFVDTDLSTFDTFCNYIKELFSDVTFLVFIRRQDRFLNLSIVNV